MEKLIKITLAILLLVCLVNLPYGYYQFVRFAAMTGFAILGYLAYEENRNKEIIIYFALAVLFQPFIKIALGRSI